ncbi:hypothetical protein [Pseudonocardia sp. D17]|uniref:hypothetical protein n=1 Tax=Pseudonocardia sp. D17 TaxID=882661 RepID=UPI002B3A7525|nr:hypothetical protein PSD17_55020 [Pseudonocardia sp. D17]
MIGRPPQLLTPTVENTVAARVARRRAFRRMFLLADEARGYVPEPYRNRLTEAQREPEPELGDDLTDSLLAVIDRAANEERAGDVLPDPS